MPAAAAAVIAAHVPPPAIVGHVADIAIERRIRTTTATPAEVWRTTLATNTGYAANLALLGVDAGNGVIKRIHAEIVAKRLSAASMVGSPVIVASHQDTGTAATASNVANWAITATISGNDFVITVTGAAGRTVDWLLRGTVASFAPGDGT